MKNLVFLLLVSVLFVSLAVPTHADTGVDKSLTKQIEKVLKECHTIKPGMTRAELSKVFTTEGGLWDPKHRTYVYRGCPYIKVDVVFTDPDQKHADEVKPTDIIATISNPYLDWSVIN